MMVSETTQQTEAATRPAFTLKNRLRAAREDARMRQTDVARAMGWPQSQVSKIETGEFRRPRFEDVVRLARLYGRELVYFSVVVE
jgi:transcriptional regulator with XRE-family HTH domain